MKVQILYKNTVKCVAPASFGRELKKLARRRIEARAIFQDVEVGWAWKNDGRWTWSFDPTAIEPTS